MKYHSSMVEPLEARIAPAAVFVDATTFTVSLSAGVLKVVPKVANDAIDATIEQLANGDFLISDLAGDDDLEDTADFSGAISAIKVASGTGDDHIAIALHGDAAFHGGITIASGSGDDIIALSEGVLRGPLTIAATGAADVAIGDPGATLDVRGAVNVTQIGGHIVLGDGAAAGAFTATGADSFELLGAVIGAATLKATGPADFAIGTALSAPAASVGGKLTVTGKTGDDFVELAHVLVRGAASFSLGGGDNFLNASFGSHFHGTAKVITGADDDIVSFGTAIDAGPQFHGRVSVNLGAATGANIFAAYSGLYDAGLAYTGTTGSDQIVIGAGTTIYSDLVIAAGNGANSADIATFSNLTKFTYNGGIDTDTVSLAGEGAGYVVGAVKLGAGSDSLTVAPGAGAFFTAFKADGGIGNDTSNIPAAVLADGFAKVNFEV